MSFKSKWAALKTACSRRIICSGTTEHGGLAGSQLVTEVAVPIYFFFKYVSVPSKKDVRTVVFVILSQLLQYVSEYT